MSSHYLKEIQIWWRYDYVLVVW